MESVGAVITSIVGAIIGTGGIAYAVLKYLTDKQKQDYEGKLNFAKQEADFQIKRQEQLFNQMLIGLKEAQDECQRLRQMVYSLENKQSEQNANPAH